MEQEDNVGDRRKALLEEAFLLVSNPGGEGPLKQLGQITNNRKFQARKKSFVAANIARCESLLRSSFGQNLQ